MTQFSASPVSRRPWRRLVLGLVLLAVAGAGGYFAWKHFFAAQNGGQAQNFVAVQRGDIEEVVTATGMLQPRDYVDVGAQVSGQLHKIHIEVGSEVKEGDLLAEIDPTLFMARVDASRAQLRYQRAQLRDREAQLTLAESQYTRQKNLLAEEATTTESLQNAEAALRSARAQIDMLKAQIEQTESSLRADEANLNYARIFAPMSGTVVSITARQGQTLNANQQAPIILRIADLSTMTVQTQVSEADVSRLRPGMEVYFTTLGGGERRWYGTLSRIEPTPTVQNNVVLYNALFDVDNASRALMTQMTAQVFFVVAAAKDALLLPMSALAFDTARRTQAGNGAPRPRQEGGERPARRATVQVVGDDGGISAREVTVGVSNRIQAQIASGLAEGERVVSVAAQAAARPGQSTPSRPARLH
ncbi:MAG: efflux transporter periplasmic adaptor subunit [Gammaproteobacteria bacterium HGW-Gammaproteobacteria-1]|jgi:macrolide-specific efflux system membrane fusion protein|nr:MAG: efflux transporter periplasmic adaptor subunit [Gammaproteobacteria bacterium HGW-Gammaproteobacteria-1]